MLTFVSFKANVVFEIVSILFNSQSEQRKHDRRYHKMSADIQIPKKKSINIHDLA